MTLTEFLEARIAEDEQEARGLLESWAESPPSVYDFGQVGWLEAGDPARVLAECEAKRRIIGREQVWRAKEGHPKYIGPLNDPWADDPAARHPDLISHLAEHYEQITDTPPLRDLALPHAHHPDYDEAWRP